MPLSPELANRFRFHPANTDERAAAHEKVRATMAAAAETLATIVPAGREFALAVTHLEDAMMWANAGIARAPQ